MEKQVYTVSVAKREINANQTNSPYEFKVSATEDEIEHLRELFNELGTTSFDNFVRAHIPYIQYHDDMENDMYDRQLIQIYRYIERLGDDKTREHIESMRVGLWDDGKTDHLS
ncbi:hydrolase [Bacillaceae bacterium SIJ1]|uniref:hydrolase n=1 Tax=Litoribacterium kuwaitense TaxID=1398745 RepID=UPI0013E9E299|nr:hydrolase [Litoribacterium kuwaitense]NGP44234.1 hydrolase [Litoribacterium kuwaitense]